MKLNNSTLEVLKNFASINPNILIEPGEVVKSMSEARNIVAIADVNDSFPKEMGIYDLNEFLSTYNLIQDPEIEYNDTNLVISNETSRVTFNYASKEILTFPEKEITHDEYEVSLNLNQDLIDQIKRAAGVLGHNDLKIIGKDGIVTAIVYDEKDSTANQFEVSIDPSNICTNKFLFAFHIPNLKLLPGDYYVNISSKLISNWTNTSFPVNYFIALEKASEFHV